MGRSINKLKSTQVSGKLKTGRHTDGGGLYLNVAKGGSKSWVFMYTRDSKRREMGLGSFPAVDLHKARRIAQGHREELQAGNDPYEERKNRRCEAKEAEAEKQRKALTFKQALDKYLEPETFGADKAPITVSRWKYGLNVHCAFLHDMLIDNIETRHVLEAIKGLWHEQPPTAIKVRQYLEAFFHWCEFKEWRTGRNPATWAKLKAGGLPKHSDIHETEHLRALDWHHVPQFMQALQAQDVASARLLEFIVLTALRSGEARGATWSEYDRQNRLLVIPASRMKTRRKKKTPHRVPLSDRAVEIIEGMRGRFSSDLIFVNPRNYRQFSVNAPRALLKRMDYDVTTHGFRSCFRGWASNNAYSFETIELALAHRVGTTVTQSYMHDDLIDPRRTMMQAWSEYCVNEHRGNVVNLNNLSAKVGSQQS